MNVSEWMKIYSEIERDFSFLRDKEIEARNTLSRILGRDFISLQELENMIPPRVFVVGFSPNLEREIELIPPDEFIIAADEASIVLKDHGLNAQIVMTDLDGNVREYSHMNAVFGIHAHGDNIHLLHHALLLEKKFGTTQIEPIYNVYNFGGFTDGDRCVFLADHFGADEIHLVGFDFKNPRRKEGKDIERKRKKLLWAKKLIEYLRMRGANIIFERLR